MDDFEWVEDIVKAETPEEFIINLMDSCDKESYNDGYYYKKGGEMYFYQDDEKGVFWFDYVNVYNVLKSKFGLNSQEMRDLIGGVLERHYNLGYTTHENVHLK